MQACIAQKCNPDAPARAGCEASVKQDASSAGVNLLLLLVLQAHIEEGFPPLLPPPNINRLHQALDIVLQRPHAPSQQSAQDAEGYAAQR